MVNDRSTARGGVPRSHVLLRTDGAGDELRERGPGPHRGLSIEAHHCSCFAPRTAALRHWLRFEELFEPQLPTVTSFAAAAADDDRVVADLEIPDWRAAVVPAIESLLRGATAHLAIAPQLGRREVRSAARDSRRVLRRAIVHPAPAGVRLHASPRVRSISDGKVTVSRSWRGRSPHCMASPRGPKVRS